MHTYNGRLMPEFLRITGKIQVRNEPTNISLVEKKYIGVKNEKANKNSGDKSNKTPWNF